MYIKAVYQILKSIDVQYEADEFNLEKHLDFKKIGISEKRLHLLLDELIKKGYIRDMKVYWYDQGGSNVSAFAPALTLNGMIYLQENSEMQRAYNLLKEAKAWIPGEVISSALGLATTLLNK